MIYFFSLRGSHVTRLTLTRLTRGAREATACLAAQKLLIRSECQVKEYSVIISKSLGGRGRWASAASAGPCSGGAMQWWGLETSRISQSTNSARSNHRRLWTNEAGGSKGSSHTGARA